MGTLQLLIVYGWFMHTTVVFSLTEHTKNGLTAYVQKARLYKRTALNVDITENKCLIQRTKDSDPRSCRNLNECARVAPTCVATLFEQDTRDCYYLACGHYYNKYFDVHYHLVENNNTQYAVRKTGCEKGKCNRGKCLPEFGSDTYSCYLKIFPSRYAYSLDRSKFLPGDSGCFSVKTNTEFQLNLKLEFPVYVTNFILSKFDFIGSNTIKVSVVDTEAELDKSAPNMPYYPASNNDLVEYRYDTYDAEGIQTGIDGHYVILYGAEMKDAEFCVSVQGGEVKETDTPPIVDDTCR